MADYHPLIARAVAGLEHNSGENRRVLYERARAALVAQLRGVDPPLEEADITRERLALEEAIRRVEAEAVRQGRTEDEGGHAPPPLREQGLRDFRDTAAEVDALGAAAAQARRQARDVFAAVPGERRPRPGESGTDGGVHFFEPPGAELPSVSEPELSHEASPDYTQRDLPESALPPPPPPAYDEHMEYARPPRAWGRIVIWVLLLVVIAGLAGAGYWQRDMVMEKVASLTAKSPPKSTLAPAQAPSSNKISDRIGSSDGAPRSATAPAAAVAQKVVLYEQDPGGDPKGKRYVGSAIWRTETVSPGPGLAPELAIRADVEIPERHMRMTFSLRRNTDKALPASHTIEIQFTLPADFPEGGIGNIPGVLMKTGEQARGIPLAGLAVKVTAGYFLIGLSAVEVDQQRNLQMLKERDWLDIPIVYTSSKRAILAIEKGTPGTRAFQEAFRAWGE